jgi:hypothetical protein
MDRGKVVKNIFESKPEGRRGRHRLRWLEDVGKDLWKIKFKRWRPNEAEALTLP